MQRNWSQDLFKWCPVAGLTQTETQEVPFKHKETLFYCESDLVPAQVSQRGRGVSHIGGIQNLSAMVLDNWLWVAQLEQVGCTRDLCQPRPFRGSV